MTPSVTPSADHVIWSTSPVLSLTWLPPCLPATPHHPSSVGDPCPRSPSLLPPSLPPHPCPSGSSASLPAPDSNHVGNDVVSDVSDDDRSDISSEQYVKNLIDIPTCHLDKVEHSNVSISNWRDCQMGCLGESSDSSSVSCSCHDSWRCRCHRVSHFCDCCTVETSCDTVCDSGCVTSSQGHLIDSVRHHQSVSDLCHRLCSPVGGDGACDVADDRVSQQTSDSASTRRIPESASNSEFLEKSINIHIPQRACTVCDCFKQSQLPMTVNNNNNNNNNNNCVNKSVNRCSDKDSDNVANRVSDQNHHRHHTHLNNNNNTNNNHCRCIHHQTRDTHINSDTASDSLCACHDNNANCDNVTCHLHAVSANRLSVSGSGSGDTQVVESYDCRHRPGRAAGLIVEWCRRCVKLPVVFLLPLLLLRRRKGRRREVIQVPQVSQVLLLLCLLLSHCLAAPWIEEGAHSVKLRAQFCQPVPRQHLHSMLGQAFDPDRMSGDDPYAGGKRSDPSQDPRMEEAALESYYYQEDDPHSAVGENFINLDRNQEEEEDWMSEEVGEQDVEEVVKRKDIMEEEEEEEGGGFLAREARSRTNVEVNPFLNMKRRKRQAGMGEEEEEGEDFAASDSELSSSREKKSRDPMLHLRLLLSSRNRKLRRKLKKEFRKKARKLARKPPPWTCSISKVWGRLKEGFFPRYLLDGRCLTDKCFYRLYDCVPQRYRIKLLKRDPDYCNPLPTVGVNSTVYEQKWSVVRYYVTVGCNCEAADPLKVPLPFQGQITRSKVSY